MILVTSSPFFSRLLKKNNKKNQSHTLIYMRGIKYDILMAMTDFIYCGETNVYQDDLESFLALAAELQLKGLEEGLKEIPKTDPIKDSEVESPTPLKTVKPMQKAKPRKVNVTEPANDHNKFQPQGRPSFKLTFSNWWRLNMTLLKWWRGVGQFDQRTTLLVEEGAEWNPLTRVRRNPI